MRLHFCAPHHSITNSHASIKGATRSMTSYPPSFYDSLYFWWILMQLADGNPFQYPQTVCFCEDRHNPQRNHKFQTFTEKSAGEKRSITELHNSVRKTGIKNKQQKKTSNAHQRDLRKASHWGPGSGFIQPPIVTSDAKECGLKLEPLVLQNVHSLACLFHIL